MTERRLGLFVAIGLVAGLTLMPATAIAAQQRAEPAVLSIGWWWEDAKTQEVDISGNKVVVGTTSPFCPSAPGSLGAVPGACAEGRLPVEIIGGDYETPNKLSALGFDLSYLTPGSTVTKFTVTLLEAEAGCTDKNEDGNINPNDGDYCEETDPYGPVDDRQVQACIVPEIFGDAEAAPYKELPSYTCSDGDPVAQRKEVKAVDKEDTDGKDHIWTFDLTPFAKQWAESFTVATNVMLVGKKPKNSGQQDSWRVIFAGPKVEKGIRTELVYEPGEIVVAPPPPGTTGTTGGTTTFGGGTTTFGGGTTTFGGGTDAGFGSEVAGGVEGAPSDPEAAPEPGEELASDLLPGSKVEGMPGYVWLALLAGIVAFSMVRQVVIESATGVRPDGVLAKIHALNASRRGIDPAAGATETTPLTAKISALFDKLPFRRKG